MEMTGALECHRDIQGSAEIINDNGMQIEELLIVHWKLALFSIGRDLKDDESGYDVLSKEVLCHLSCQAKHDNEYREALADLKRCTDLSSLCKAIYDFPEAVGQRHGVCQVVAFEKACLHIVPLDEEAGIFAIAKVESQGEDNCLREYIVDHYVLFSLLRGSIHETLLEKSTDNFYPCMRPIYDAVLSGSMQSTPGSLVFDRVRVELRIHFESLLEAKVRCVQSLLLMPLTREDQCLAETISTAMISSIGSSPLDGLSGVSMFFRDALVAEWWAGRKAILTEHDRLLITRHMKSFKVLNARQKDSTASNGLVRLVSSLSMRQKDQQMPLTNGKTVCDFVSPPPLSMVSSTDKIKTITGPDGARVWVLPIVADSVDGLAVSMVQIVGDLVGLLFLKLSSSHQTNEDVIRNVHERFTASVAAAMTSDDLKASTVACYQ